MNTKKLCLPLMTTSGLLIIWGLLNIHLFWYLIIPSIILLIISYFFTEQEVDKRIKKREEKNGSDRF